MDIVSDEPGKLSQEPVRERHVVDVVKNLSRSVGISPEKVLDHYARKLLLEHPRHQFPSYDSSSSLITKNITQWRYIGNNLITIIITGVGACADNTCYPGFILTQ